MSGPRPSHSSHSSHSAPGTARSGRGIVDAYERYARVLADQLDALEAADPDLGRFHELAEERERIAREIEADDDGAGAHPSQRPTVAARLEECRALDRQVIERLKELRAGTVDALRGMQERTDDRNSYLATARARTESAHFDVTF